MSRHILRTRSAHVRFLAALVLVAIVPALRAGNWPGWRGPTGVGSCEEKDLPLTWGGKNNANILWKVHLTGRSSSSPIAWGERVFVTTSAKQTDKEVKDKAIPAHFVTCYRASDGKEMWRTSVPPGKFADGYYSIPTPVTDGKRVYAWFGSGVAAALDLEGNLLWRQEHAGPYHVYPGVSSSPVLFGETLLILVDQGKESFLLALDRATGQVKWEKKRPNMHGSSNSTPVLFEVQGQPQLVVCGANVLQGLDPATGDVRWWCAKDGGYWTSLTCGSGLVYADSGGGRGQAVDPSGTGDVGKSKVKWSHAKVPEGLGCPLIVGDYVYRASKPDMVRCWKLSTGEPVFEKRLSGISFLASPFATADGRIYFASPRKSYILRAAVPRLEVLASNEIKDGGDDGPSPAVAGGRIFLKTTEHLWCVGKK